MRLVDLHLDQPAERPLDAGGPHVGHGHHRAAVAAEQALEIDPAIDRLTGRADDAVERAEARRRGRARGGRDPDDREGVVGLDADPPHLVDEIQRAPRAREERRHRHRAALLGPLHDQLHGLLWVGLDDAGQLVERADVLAVRLDHAVARLEHPVGGAVGEDRAHHRGDRLRVAEVDDEEEPDGQEQVHRRPREDDDHALPERLLREGAPLVLRADVVVGALPEHAHVAAEGERRDHVLGAAAREPGDPRTEAEREFEDADAEEFRPREVAELVHEHEHADQDDEVDDLHGEVAYLRSASGACTVMRSPPAPLAR